VLRGGVSKRERGEGEEGEEEKRIESGELVREDVNVVVSKENLDFKLINAERERKKLTHQIHPFLFILFKMSETRRRRSRSRSEERKRIGGERDRDFTRDDRGPRDYDRRDRDRDYYDSRRDRDYYDNRRDRDYDGRRDSRERVRDRDYTVRDDREPRDRKDGAPAGTSVADLFKVLSSSTPAPPTHSLINPLTNNNNQVQLPKPNQPSSHLETQHSQPPQPPASSSGASAIPGPELVASLLSKLQQQMQASAPPPGNKLLRELHISGIPVGRGVTTIQLKDFFNSLMLQSGFAHAGGKESIVTARIADSGTFGFIECRTEQEANSIISLGSIPFYHGATLKINRPRGYVPPQPALVVGSQSQGGNEVLASLGLSGQSLLVGGPKLGALGIGGAKQQEQNALDAQLAKDAIAADAIFVSNLAPGITSTQLHDLFISFGKLVTAYVFQQKATTNSSTTSSSSSSSSSSTETSHISATGGETETGVVEFEDKSIIDKVIGSLNGLSVASVPMRVSRATAIQLREAKEEQERILSESKANVNPPPSPLSQQIQPPKAPAFSLILNNIFLAQELVGSESNAKEIIEDIRSDVEGECSKYGRVISVTISMPSPSQISQAVTTTFQQGELNSSSVPILVTFATEEERKSAAASLKGRKFDGRVINIEFG
jgi:splicing factor U2AF 65 kDa subunit